MNMQYDVIVLGAGINGVAIAKEMAAQKKSVLVIEKSTIACGASSHSSRLIHGGLRYLENFEFSLVKEALQDQKYLLDTYPHLVKLHPFYYPLYKNSMRKPWMIQIGLWLYSFFSKHNTDAKPITNKEFLKKFVLMKEESLEKVFQYYDAKTDDYALTCTVAEEAKALGAEIVENTNITRLAVNEDEICIEIESALVKTNRLINASGAWIDEVNKKFHLTSSYMIEKISGIHLVIDRILVPEPLILETGTKRIFFIIPQESTTLIGTTERVENADIDAIKVNNEDVEYLLEESNRYLKKKLTRDDIKEVFIGIRPIIKTKKDPSKMSREYKLDLHHIGKNTILHVYGGKLTTFPSLAKRAVAILMK